jgi:hypothetical protein
LVGYSIDWVPETPMKLDQTLSNLTKLYITY